MAVLSPSLPTPMAGGRLHRLAHRSPVCPSYTGGIGVDALTFSDFLACAENIIIVYIHLIISSYRDIGIIKRINKVLYYKKLNTRLKYN